MLKEDISRAVEKYHEGFREFCGRNHTLAFGYHPYGGFHVPRPTILGEAAHPASECKKTVPKEDAAFDCVCKTAKDSDATLNTG